MLQNGIKARHCQYLVSDPNLVKECGNISYKGVEISMTISARMQKWTICTSSELRTLFN